MQLSKKELDQMLARQAKIVSKESDIKMQNYIGALKEDFDHKLDVVLEILPDIQKKVDLTFDKVGENTVDNELLKDIAKNHEVRLQKLEVK